MIALVRFPCKVKSTGTKTQRSLLHKGGHSSTPAHRQPRSAGVLLPPGLCTQTRHGGQGVGVPRVPGHVPSLPPGSVKGWGQGWLP